MKDKIKSFIALLVLNLILSGILFTNTAFAANGSITLAGANIPNKNAIGLQWFSQIQNPEEYKYRVFQKTPSGTSFQTVPVMYNLKVNVLWIYMYNNASYAKAIEDFPKQNGMEDSLYIKTIYYTDYNNNPTSYLKDAQGNYMYDIIFFGAYDMNSVERYDLSSAAKNETAKFLDAGRGAIFTHDTIRNGHPNYVELGRKYAHIDAQNTAISTSKDTIGGKTATVSEIPSVLTAYPFKLPNTISISLTHTSGQILGDDVVVWSKFINPSYGNKNLVDSKDNFFLATYNNAAMIQMGHTALGLTKDEQSTLLNLLFFMGQLTPGPTFLDPSGIDSVPPDKPSISLQGNTLLLSSSDSGTNYQYYVEAVNQKTGEKIQSNTVSILNKAGVAGYVITYDEEQGVAPVYGTMPNTPAIPAVTIDIVKNRGKYANITAVDFAGNYSQTVSISIISDVDPLNLTAASIGKDGGISLNWINPDNSEIQKYRIFQNSSSKFDIMQTNFGEPIKVLQVYPDNSVKNELSRLVNSYGPKDSNNNNLISVSSVLLYDFNLNPSKYLRSDGTANGQFLYDEIVFGFNDYNGYSDEKGDLSTAAKDEVEKFLKTGRGVLLGHDTVLGTRHPNFKALGVKYMGMNPLSSYSTKAIGGIRISKSNEGTVYQYPYSISSGPIAIARTHSSSQMLGTQTKTWFKFSAPTNYGNDNLITDNSANFYLATNGNIGMIQSGHTNGKFTIDETKILMNTLFYMSQLTSRTNFQDKTAKDSAAPSAPQVNISGNNVALSSKDNGTTYSYYVESICQTTNNKIPSNKISVDCTSGIKEYLVIEDNNSSSVPSSSSKSVSADNASYTLSGNNSYLHVIAIDYAGNQSSVTHIRLK